jgi:hypothetical protein
MSGFIVLLPALAGLAVPLSLLAGVSFFAASHCPGLERVDSNACRRRDRAEDGGSRVAAYSGIKQGNTAAPS